MTPLSDEALRRIREVIEAREPSLVHPNRMLALVDEIERSRSIGVPAGPWLLRKEVEKVLKSVAADRPEMESKWAIDDIRNGLDAITKGRNR